jgi:acyl-coenzyme A thioesterase PaaI-like protein
MPWTFGVEPLPQTVDAAALLRQVTGLVLSLEQDEDDVARLLDVLRDAQQRLSDLAPVEVAPRMGATPPDDGRVYLDHSRDIGAFNPCFPEYQVEVDGDRASGTVHFPVVFEGPPGVVHGGFLAVLFDSVIQHHNCEVGVAGKTTSLSLQYRRPSPIGTDLAFELTRTEADGRITSTGTLMHGERLLCEARMDAVAGSQDALPEISPRRPRA